MPDLPRTVAEAAEAVRLRRLSAVELTQALLERAEAAQASLGAFITITREPALVAARAADAALASGTPVGPLHGVPIGVKDIIRTIDAPTSANSRVMDPAWGAGRDATVVRRLREAGAIVLGKLVLSEYAIGYPDPSTGFPVPHNPWNVEHWPGGSSSGTGAAVAAGLVLAGLGTDTGGSIRGPSAYCGITGIKPTFGRVSKEGCVPLGYSLDHIGPMARTARDCAIMLQVMAGYDPLDPTSANVPVPDMTAALDGSLRGVRVGVPRGYFFDAEGLLPEVKDAVLTAVAQMVAAGAVAIDVDIPHAAAARNAQRVIMYGEAFAYHAPDLRTQADRYGKYTRQSLRQGAFFSAADYVQAQRVRSLVKQETASALADADVLVMPTAIGVAPRLDAFDFEDSMKQPSLMGIWNLTGSPALSVGCGFSSSGLPIGMQIVGKPFDEPMVLKVADAFQTLTDWHLRTPATVREPQPA